MSKLDDLIKEKCPNGVRFYNLGDVCDIKTGRGVTKADAGKGGEYPIISGGKFPLGYIDIYNREPNTVTIARAGSAGYVDYITTRFYLNDKCFSVIPNTSIDISSRYLYFFLKNMEDDIVAMQSTGSVPTVNTIKISGIRVAIPPLEVQNEIVQYLDNFAELTAELTAELSNRKKQYRYYKNVLFDLKSTPMIALGDCCVVQAGGTPSKTKPEYWTDGNIKWLSSTVCKNTKDIDDITGHITELGLAKSSAKVMKPGTTLIALVGATIGKTAYLKFDAAINQNVAGIYPINDNKLDPSYVYYACTMLYNQFINLSNGKLAMANMSFVRGLKIPVPQIETQRKIVSLLDKFEAINSSFEEGLPAEIEARERQYAYYRDKLLSFKELVPNA